MTAYLTAIEAALAVLLLIAAVAVGWHFGGLGPKAALETQHAEWAQATAQALLAQRKGAQAQAINDNAAETAHDQTIEALPARIVRTPVFLRAPGDLCPDRVPTPQAQAASEHPPSGAVESGRGGDLRPAIEALKIKYETALADCRRLDAEWPSSVASRTTH